MTQMQKNINEIQNIKHMKTIKIQDKLFTIVRDGAGFDVFYNDKNVGVFAYSFLDNYQYECFFHYDYLIQQLDKTIEELIPIIYPVIGNEVSKRCVEIEDCIQFLYDCICKLETANIIV